MHFYQAMDCALIVTKKHQQMFPGRILIENFEKLDLGPIVPKNDHHMDV